MIRRRLLVSLASASLAGAALTGVAAPANATSTCPALHQQVVAAHETYTADREKYGPNDSRTKQAYANYRAKAAQYDRECG